MVFGCRYSTLPNIVMTFPRYVTNNSDMTSHDVTHKATQALHSFSAVCAPYGTFTMEEASLIKRYAHFTDSRVVKISIYVA